MLSVIIATRDSERALVPTLAALVPGATAGVISEVLLVDGGSTDDTATVADIAGCNFMTVKGPLGERLKTAAAKARAPWLLFLRPGIVLDAPWVGEARHFTERPQASPQAAVFRLLRLGDTAQSPLRQAWLLLTAALGAGPHPEQGLIISKLFYAEISGHLELAADPEADLLHRIGRRRIVTLSTSAFAAR
jgi:glycosyltransferase involved in cell wall biosynthesis